MFQSFKELSKFCRKKQKISIFLKLLLTVDYNSRLTSATVDNTYIVINVAVIVQSYEGTGSHGTAKVSRAF